MKPENTIENKAAFFALYWGQKVLKGVGYPDHKPYDLTHYEMESPSNHYLYLIHPQYITDEDAMEIINMMDVNPSKNHFWIQMIRTSGIIYTLDLRNTDSEVCFISLDFLRSRGYALPWKGLSVDDLVEYGWVKLQEVEK